MTIMQAFSSFADMPQGLRHFLYSEEFRGVEADLQKIYALD